MNTPVKETRGEIQRAARRLERAMAQRRALVKQLRRLDGEIRTARRFLTTLIEHVARGGETA